MKRNSKYESEAGPRILGGDVLALTKDKVKVKVSLCFN
jgi:hypothetical protein